MCVVVPYFNGNVALALFLKKKSKDFQNCGKQGNHFEWGVSYNSHSAELPKAHKTPVKVALNQISPNRNTFWKLLVYDK